MVLNDALPTRNTQQPSSHRDHWRINAWDGKVMSRHEFFLQNIRECTSHIPTKGTRYIFVWSKDDMRSIFEMYPSHRSHNAPGPYPTMHHFVADVCTYVANCGICEMDLLPHCMTYRTEHETSRKLSDQFPRASYADSGICAMLCNIHFHRRMNEFLCIKRSLTIFYTCRRKKWNRLQ